MRTLPLIICLTLVFTLMTVRTHAGEAKKGGAEVGEYNAVKQYEGPFKNKGLYYHPQGGMGWVPIGRFFTGPVTCPEALESLGTTGYWKGHLERNGSCGSKAEPQDWVTGNRRNYNIKAGINENPTDGSGNNDE